MRETAAETVLVTVNGKSLTSGMAKGIARQMAARQGVPPQMLDTFLAQAGTKFEKQAVRQFVNQALLEAEVAKSDISVSNEEIDAMVARVTDSLPEGATLEQALAPQGMTLDQLRENIKKNEQIRKLYEAETVSGAPVTDAQIKTFYEENPDRFNTKESVDASHILIACDESADAEAHAKAKTEAEAVRKQLVEGAEFAELAKEKSSCPSKERGGALGTFQRGRMVPEFEKAAFSQPVGEFGPVVKTKFGYHIILATDKKQAGVRSLEEAGEDIKKLLTNQARETLFNAYLDSLREKAEITYGESKQPAAL